MNADAFRHFYDYHFAENRKIWDSYISQLSDQQFAQDETYSHGSVRNQIVHLINVDDGWFGELQGQNPEDLDASDASDRAKIRAHWDGVEQKMRDYLAGLTDEKLFERPIESGRDRDLTVWQVLLHVANHGTDHRAQTLRLLNDLGMDTKYQDYIFYVYGHPL